MKIDLLRVQKTFETLDTKREKNKENKKSKKNNENKKSKRGVSSPFEDLLDEELNKS